MNRSKNKDKILIKYNKLRIEAQTITSKLINGETKNKDKNSKKLKDIAKKMTEIRNNNPDIFT